MGQQCGQGEKGERNSWERRARLKEKRGKKKKETWSEKKKGRNLKRAVSVSFSRDYTPRLEAYMPPMAQL